MVNKAIFLDRDGVINELVPHNGKLTAPWNFSEFKLYPNVKESIDVFKNLDFYVFVVTNQPDVLDGYLDQNSLDLMHKMLLKWFRIDEIFYSSIRGSEHYKPNNMMLEDLIVKYDIDRDKSFMIGDSWKDIVCSYKSNVRSIYIGEEYTCPDQYKYIIPKITAVNLLHAAYIIEGIVMND